MGAGASIAGTVSNNASAGVAVKVDDEEDIVCGLRQLPDAMDEAVYVREKWPCVIDPTGQAGRFLKYQRGAFISTDDILAYTSEGLRRAVVAGLKHGNMMTISTSDWKSLKLATLFNDDTYFPEAVLHRSQIFNESVWSKLLRTDAGDPAPHEFLPRTEFAFVLCTTCEEDIPPEVSKRMSIIRVKEKESNAGASATASSEDAVESLYNAAEVKRNSTQLVEAAFDGEMDDMVKWIEKGFHFESTDGHKQTALSEASCQGHMHVVSYLLELGADPNALSDTGRSPIYRASYNGHAEVVRALLSSGADPDLRDIVSHEAPYDVAKTDEVRTLLQQWDRAQTHALKELRRKEMERRQEERIKTASEREALAKERIRKEVIDCAVSGNIDELKSILEMLASEAEKLSLSMGAGMRARPRGSVACRDEHGMTPLHIAAKRDDVALATFLLTYWKTLDEDRWDLTVGEVSVTAKVFKADVNARDLRGWTPCAIAVFHNSCKVLRLLLEHNADPYIKSSYHRSAVDLAQDEVDAAGQVVVSKQEIRAVIVEWEANKSATRVGESLFSSPVPAALIGPAEELPHDGTAVAMNIEMISETVAKGKGGTKKAAGGGGKGSAAKSGAATATKSAKKK